VEPETFSPDGDGFEDTTVFTVRLWSSCPYDEGALTIWDQQGQELVYWSFSGHGEWDEEWNGLDDLGDPLPNGDYQWGYDGSTWDGAGYEWWYHYEGVVTIMCLGPIALDLEMESHAFAPGDVCSLILNLENSGAARPGDLYVLLSAGGGYWSYPSWSPGPEGLDSLPLFLDDLAEESLLIVPGFTVPEVSSPLFCRFYAAIFEPDTLDGEHLISNVSTWNFSIGRLAPPGEQPPTARTWR
jgi:hypothetical protein